MLAVLIKCLAAQSYRPFVKILNERFAPTRLDSTAASISIPLLSHRLQLKKGIAQGNRMH
jgi:hypothetical protein